MYDWNLLRTTETKVHKLKHKMHWKLTEKHLFSNVQGNICFLHIVREFVSLTSQSTRFNMY